MMSEDFHIYSDDDKICKTYCSLIDDKLTTTTTTTTITTTTTTTTTTFESAPFSRSPRLERPHMKTSYNYTNNII